MILACRLVPIKESSADDFRIRPLRRNILDKSLERGINLIGSISGPDIVGSDQKRDYIGISGDIKIKMKIISDTAALR